MSKANCSGKGAIWVDESGAATTLLHGETRMALRASAVQLRGSGHAAAADEVAALADEREYYDSYCGKSRETGKAPMTTFLRWLNDESEARTTTMIGMTMQLYPPAPTAAPPKPAAPPTPAPPPHKSTNETSLLQNTVLASWALPQMWHAGGPLTTLLEGT